MRDRKTYTQSSVYKDKQERKNKNTTKRKGKEPDKMMLKKSRILFYMTRNQIRLKSTEASAKDLVLFSNKNNVTTITLNNPG